MNRLSLLAAMLLTQGCLGAPFETATEAPDPSQDAGATPADDAGMPIRRDVDGSSMSDASAPDGDMTVTGDVAAPPAIDGGSDAAPGAPVRTQYGVCDMANLARSGATPGGPDGCLGCCTADGVCVAGTSNLACGTAPADGIAAYYCQNCLSDAPVLSVPGTCEAISTGYYACQAPKSAPGT